LVRLEEAPDEGLVHDRHVFGRIGIGRGEVSAPNESNAEILQIVRTDPIPRGDRWISRRPDRMARRKHELAPVGGERVVEREPRTSYAWQPTDSLLHVAIERGELWAGVVRGRSVEIDEDAPANLEPEVLAFEVRQAASQQGRPRDED